jgi:hypothetical protein
MSFQLAPLLAKNRHKRPIGARFYLGGAKFSYLGEDLEDALGEPEKAIAGRVVWERTAEHFHGVLSGN